MVARREPEDLEDDFLDGDPFLLAEEVAPMFRVGAKTVARWALAGKLPGIKTPGGGPWRFRESVIRKYLVRMHGRAKGDIDGTED